MHRVVAVILIAVGLLHLYPALGVFGPERLGEIYDIVSDDADTLLLLRHRAVLFAMLGVALIAGGIRVRWRWPALLAGLVSTLSFVLLAFPLDDNSAAVTRVFWTDVVSSAALILAGIIALRYPVPVNTPLQPPAPTPSAPSPSPPAAPPAP